LSTQPTADPSLRVYVLDTGMIDHDDYGAFSPGMPAGVRRSMTVKSYLIEHPRGTLLWDTGIEDAIGDRPAGLEFAEGVVFRVPRTLRSQLAEIGRAPEEIDILGLSHLHIDHLGNIVPEARVLLHEDEFDAGYGDRAEELGYIPSTYAGIDRDRIEKLSGEHDVFGDGSVVTVPLPGHTIGHQGLVVRLGQSGTIVIGSDVAHCTRNLEQLLVPESNYDEALSIQSMEAVNAIAEAEGATVWVQHDIDQQAGVRDAPEWYE
jgi:N-acyl homoserine lactone hydrolase